MKFPPPVAAIRVALRLLVLLRLADRDTAGLPSSRLVPLLARGMRLVRRRRRALVLTVGSTVTYLADMAAAVAASTPPPPPILSTFNVTDENGYGVSLYNLDIDHGGLLHPWKSMIAFPLELGWEAYRWTVGGVAWAIDWVLQFGWVSVLTTVATQIGDALQTSIVGRMGLLTMMVSLAGVVCGLWILRGGLAKGLGELFVSLTIAALAAGYLAHPVTTVAGPNGLLPKAQDAAVQISAGILGDTQDGGEDQAQLRKATSGAIITDFVRIPQQLLNYGAVIDDDPKCKPAYDAALMLEQEDDDSGDPDPSGLLAALTTPRSMVGHCNSAYGKVASNPGFGQIISLMVLAPAALGLLLFAGLFIFALITAVVFMLYESVKLIINLLWAIVPGMGRGGLWQSLTGVAVGLATVVVSTVFLAAYMAVIRAVFAGTASWAVAARFLLVDLILFAGLVLFMAQRRKLRKAGENLARKLNAMKVGSGGSRLPERNPVGFRQGAAQLATIGSGLRRNLAAGAAGGIAGAGAVEALEHHQQGKRPLSTRLAESKAGRTGKFAVKTAAFAAKATVGAPVYGPRVAKVAAAASVKRANALRTRLQSAQAGAAAFAGEYTGNLATAGRGAVKVAAVASNLTGTTAATKAAGRAAAPAVVAAVIAGSGRRRQAPQRGPKPASQEHGPEVPGPSTRPSKPAARRPTVRLNKVPAATTAAAPAVRPLPVTAEVRAERMRARLRAAAGAPATGRDTPEPPASHRVG